MPSTAPPGWRSPGYLGLAARRRRQAARARRGGVGTLVVDRELEGGLVERLRIGLPALLTIQTGINQPRYANLRAIKQAREKPLEVVEAGDLGLDDGRARGRRRLATARAVPARPRRAAPR